MSETTTYRSEGMCDYRITRIFDDTVCLVENSRDWRSITNAAELVIEDLTAAGLLVGRRVIYRDDFGDWDELRHDGNRFCGFRSLGGAQDLETALARLRDPDLLATAYEKNRNDNT